MNRRTLISIAIGPLHRPVRAWQRFWFEPISPVSICLYRVLYGASILLFLALLWPDALTFFGDRAVLSPRAGEKLWTIGPHPSLLFWLTSRPAVLGFFIVLTLAALCLTIGLWSRLSALIVFVGLISIERRNPLVLNGTDVALRVMAFYLIFAPCGAALSLDRLIGVARGRAPARPPLSPPWAQRLLQLQVALIYASTVLLKLKGTAWTSGVALYYTSRLEEFHRLPLPFVAHSMLLVNLLTYWTLAVEAALALLVWVPALRPFVLLNGVLLHAGIEYSLNIPQFSFAMVATYVAFTDVEGWWAQARCRWPLRRLARATLLLDPDCAACRRGARLVHALDLCGRLEIAGADGCAAGRPLLRLDSGEQRAGAGALRWLARALPLLWPLAPLAGRPPVRRLLAALVCARSVTSHPSATVSADAPAVAAVATAGGHVADITQENHALTLSQAGGTVGVQKGGDVDGQF